MGNKRIFEFKIHGETPSKKNNIKFSSHGEYKSKRFREWHKMATVELLPQRPKEPAINYPVLIKMEFTHGDKRRRDSDNGTSSILDLLVDVGILADDNYSIVRDLEITNFYDKNKSQVKITICEL